MKRFKQYIRNWKLTSGRRAVLLLTYLIITLLLPNFILAYTELYNGWSIIAGLLIPAGLYLLANIFTQRIGITAMFMIPIIILCAFQIVLLYIYGNSVIATDMFINLMTTNSEEASELLTNLWPPIIIVCVIYVPLLWEAFIQVRRKMRLSVKTHNRVVHVGYGLLAAGMLFLIPAYKTTSGNVMLNEIFPINVIYNFNIAVSEELHVKNYRQTSKQFKYNAVRDNKPSKREIYVLIIGEASRAANWELYGYSRETNPRLKQRNDICLFKNVITQSNTTHKSVPLFLSSISTDQHRELYYRKGLSALFKEAGFKTHFLSNQSPQGAMVDNLAKEADEVVYIGSPRHDMQLLRMMRRIIETDKKNNLLFILHSYGSHFSYHQRYPREFARFQPDNNVTIQPQNIEMIRNAYDNSIVYTDYFLDSTIAYLNSLDACSALLYCSDHGEDIFDDERGRFLHASPTTTYYQLHVASLAWFSQTFRDIYPEKIEAAEKHRWSPATTHSMFHTIADMASIKCNFVDQTVSLVSNEFDETAPRFYLNDHNEAVPFNRRIGITDLDVYQFAIHGIRLDNE